MKARLTDQHLAQVAAIYTRAMSERRPPAPVIAEHFGRPVVTVHRWVAKARERGFLSPTRQGIASGTEGIAPVLAAEVAAELGIETDVLLAALRKHRIELRRRNAITDILADVRAGQEAL